MYSDVPATNVLGPDSVRVRRALEDPVLFRRLLAAKNVVLWVLITPICCLVALLIGVANHNLLSTVITVVWIGIVPFGALGISNLVGIRFPYHPMPLRYPLGSPASVPAHDRALVDPGRRRPTSCSRRSPPS